MEPPCAHRKRVKSRYFYTRWESQRCTNQHVAKLFESGLPAGIFLSVNFEDPVKLQCLTQELRIQWWLLLQMTLQGALPQWPSLTPSQQLQEGSAGFQQQQTGGDYCVQALCWGHHLHGSMQPSSPSQEVAPYSPHLTNGDTEAQSCSAAS